jgi:hypothetical protein
MRGSSGCWWDRRMQEDRGHVYVYKNTYIYIYTYKYEYVHCLREGDDGGRETGAEDLDALLGIYYMYICVCIYEYTYVWMYEYLCI